MKHGPWFSTFGPGRPSESRLGSAGSGLSCPGPATQDRRVPTPCASCGGQRASARHGGESRWRRRPGRGARPRRRRRVLGWPGPRRAPSAVTAVIDFRPGPEAVERSAAGRGICFSAPLAADLWALTGPEPVVEGRAAGRELSFSAPFAAGVDVWAWPGPGPGGAVRRGRGRSRAGKLEEALAFIVGNCGYSGGLT